MRYCNICNKKITIIKTRMANRNNCVTRLTSKEGKMFEQGIYHWWFCNDCWKEMEIEKIGISP